MIHKKRFNKFFLIVIKIVPISIFVSYIILWTLWEDLLKENYSIVFSSLLTALVSIKFALFLENNQKFTKFFQSKYFNLRWIFLFISLLILPLLSSFLYLIDGTEEPKIFIFLIITVMALLFFSSFLIGFKLYKNKPNLKVNGLNNKIVALFSIAIIIGTPVIPYLIQGYKATIPDNYESNIGPFLHFGPFTDNKAASSANSIVIWWFEPEETSTSRTILYGTDSDLSSMVSVNEFTEGADGKRHEIHLTGLNPNTVYFYTIPNFSTKTYNFSTGPEIDSSDPFRFVSVGDTRNGGGTSVSMYGDLNKAINYFYANQPTNPAFVLNLGDIVSSGLDLDSWEVFFDDVSSQAPNMAYMTTIGNHELFGDHDGNNFNYVMGHPQYYSFDYGNTHFIQLQTFDNPDVPYYSTGDEQYEWVKKDLEANAGDKWTVISFHVPFLTTEARREYLKYQYYDLFRENEVDLVLTAHDHHYDSFLVDETRDFNGTIYMVNGGGGAEIDAYMMDIWDGEWKANSSSSFLNDQSLIIQETYRIGEVAWGFVDVQISDNMLNVSYYRWLDFPKYMQITGQTINVNDYMDYEMKALSSSDWTTYNLSNVELVESIVKYRDF